MKSKFNFLLIFTVVLCLFAIAACDISGGHGGKISISDDDYPPIGNLGSKEVEAWHLRTTGTYEMITVHHRFSGKYVDIFCDENLRPPLTTAQLRLAASHYDRSYERLTSFLKMYEGTRIQVNVHDMTKDQDAYASPWYNSVGASPRMVQSITTIEWLDMFFAHELGHVFLRWRHENVDRWYDELIAILVEVIFFHRSYNTWIDVDVPILEWPATNRADEGPCYEIHHNLAWFLVNKYGDTIYYDLMHENTVNKKALENVLLKRSTTLSVVQSEFHTWNKKNSNKP